jgi:YegS/Rv2252/BmrU family lipid kinase
MSQIGLKLSVHTTRRPGEARDVARRSGEESVDALMVCGGDGTISEVVDGLAGSDVPVFLVPGGTENLLARYFRLHLDADALWQVFRQSRTISLDVALYNGKRFLLVAGVGPDAEAVRLLSEQRRGRISHWNYVKPVWQTLCQYRYHRLCVEADGIPVHQGPAWVLIGNVPQYALGLQILHRACPNDGLLDLCIVPAHSHWPVLWHFWKTWLQEHEDSPAVIYRQARHIRVWSDGPVPLEVDGDFAGWLPAEFRLAPEKIRFMVPNDWQMPNSHPDPIHVSPLPTA